MRTKRLAMKFSAEGFHPFQQLKVVCGNDHCVLFSFQTSTATIPAVRGNGLMLKKISTSIIE